MALKSTDEHKRRPDVTLNPLFSRGAEVEPIPRDRMPDDQLDPTTAYQLVHDQLMLDGNARLNLATFVTTWMEPEADRLMAESVDKNMIDKDEYPQTAALEARCVEMLARLWNAPEGVATGCSTTGSSEAAMLAGLALKRRWQHARRAAGKDTSKPNIVMGINVQVCWDKFANYWDVEPRLVPMDGDQFCLTPEGAVSMCDENTIGVVAVLGSTFDGSYEPVADIAKALDQYQKDTGIDIPLHVDGASGAMIAPFLDPDLEWDFRIDRVCSINTSGHKYGLVYPGVGWIIWRDVAALPDDLVFRVNYLGGEMPTFALNFSRPGAQVIAQYYCFVRLGFEGYRLVQQSCRDVAMHIAKGVDALPDFTLLTDGSQLPVFAFRMADGVDDLNVFEVSRGLRERGWLVPAYTFPANRTDLAALRIVVRNGFSHELAELLLEDLRRVVDRSPESGGAGHSPADAGFSH